MGVPGLHNPVWHGVWAPGAVSRDVIVKFNAAIVETRADGSVRTRFTDMGQDIPPRAEQTPQALAAFHKQEIDKWFPLIRGAGIRAE